MLGDVDASRRMVGFYLDVQVRSDTDHQVGGWELDLESNKQPSHIKTPPDVNFTIGSSPAQAESLYPPNWLKDTLDATLLDVCPPNFMKCLALSPSRVCNNLLVLLVATNSTVVRCLQGSQCSMVHHLTWCLSSPS